MFQFMLLINILFQITLFYSLFNSFFKVSEDESGLQSQRLLYSRVLNPSTKEKIYILQYGGVISNGIIREGAHMQSQQGRVGRVRLGTDRRGEGSDWLMCIFFYSRVSQNVRGKKLVEKIQSSEKHKHERILIPFPILFAFLSFTSALYKPPSLQCDKRSIELPIILVSTFV